MRKKETPASSEPEVVKSSADFIKGFGDFASKLLEAAQSVKKPIQLLAFALVVIYCIAIKVGASQSITVLILASILVLSIIGLALEFGKSVNPEHRIWIALAAIVAVIVCLDLFLNWETHDEAIQKVQEQALENKAFARFPNIAVCSEPTPNIEQPGETVEADVESAGNDMGSSHVNFTALVLSKRKFVACDVWIPPAQNLTAQTYNYTVNKWQALYPIDLTKPLPDSAKISSGARLVTVAQSNVKKASLFVFYNEEMLYAIPSGTPLIFRFTPADGSSLVYMPYCALYNGEH